MGSPRVELPAPGPEALRDYLPALSYAVQAVRQREKALEARFEVVAARVARDARMELEELREIIEQQGENDG